jgi:hypothetical protein
VRASTAAAADGNAQAYKLQAGEGFAALAKATALQLRHESSAMQPAPNVTVFYRGNAIGTISSTFIEHMVRLSILQPIKRCFYFVSGSSQARVRAAATSHQLQSHPAHQRQGRHVAPRSENV